MLFSSPHCCEGCRDCHYVKGMPLYNASFAPLVADYVRAGGGVFMWPANPNVGAQPMFDLTEHFEAKLPLELFLEGNQSNTAALDHMGDEPLAWTDAVDSTQEPALTKGVGAIWYPTRKDRNGAQTTPLFWEPSAGWQAIIRATPTTTTQAIPDGTSGAWAPVPSAQNFSTASVAGAPIFAVRNVGIGRVALLSQYHQYTIGSGWCWLFDNQVLRRGVDGRKSDMLTLLMNTFSWLGDSKPGSVVGGYKTPRDFFSPVTNASLVEEYGDPVYNYSSSTLTPKEQYADAKNVFKGLIGVRTSYSDGHGTVAEYAAAAKVAGLDWLVVTENLTAGMTAAKLEQLRTDCAQHSTPQLKLFPGLILEADIGNKLMLWGEGVVFPPDTALTPDRRALNIQNFNVSTGNFSGEAKGAFSYLLSALDSNKLGDNSSWTVGYYHLGPSRPAGAMKMTDLRAFSGGAVFYYDASGVLVEDLREDFKEYCESTISPVPMTMSEVLSPSLLPAAAKTQVLTYARAHSLDSMFGESLRWNNQFDAFDSFVSSGPIINAWSGIHRVYTLGDARFATGRALMAANLSVEVNDRSGATTLRNVSIFNGRALFRSFSPHASQMYRVEMLDGFVHRNLVAEITDSNGGVAISFPRRSLKPGVPSVEFCGDHVNDCASGAKPILAHGPVSPRATWVPSIQNPGTTWDGGPGSPNLALLTFERSRPVLTTTDNSVEDLGRCSQTPHLETSDEGHVAVNSVQDRIFDDRVVSVGSPWSSFGPIAGPTQLINATLRYKQLFSATVGFAPVAAEWPDSDGMIITIFTAEIQFKKAVTVSSLQVLEDSTEGKGLGNVGVAIAASAQHAPVILNASNLTTPFFIRVEAGGWWGVWSDRESNSHLFFNRADPVQVRIARFGTCGRWFQVHSVNVTAQGVHQEQALDNELTTGWHAPLATIPRDAPRNYQPHPGSVCAAGVPIATKSNASLGECLAACDKEKCACFDISLLACRTSASAAIKPATGQNTAYTFTSNMQYSCKGEAGARQCVADRIGPFSSSTCQAGGCNAPPPPPPAGQSFMPHPGFDCGGSPIVSNITSLGGCARQCETSINCTCFSVGPAGCRVLTTPAALVVNLKATAYTPWAWQLYACKGGTGNATCKPDAFGSFNDSKCLGSGTVPCQNQPTASECTSPQDTIGMNYSVSVGEHRRIEVLQVGVSVYTTIDDAAAMLALREYILSPVGLQVVRGSRIDSTGASGLLEMQLDPTSRTAEVSLPKHPLRGYVLGLRLVGINARWTACLLQKEGWVFDPLSLYGPTGDRYTELGIDADSTTVAPLYVGRAKLTHVVAGHPIVATGGHDVTNLFIQVTHVSQGVWHVSVHNPTAAQVTATISKTMELPGLEFATKSISVKAGATTVLV